jgi:hypothetical protein
MAHVRIYYIRWGRVMDEGSSTFGVEGLIDWVRVLETNKKRRMCETFSFLVATTGIEPVFHA